MKEPDLNPPGRIPYRWFWVLGGVMLCIAVISALQGVAFLAIVNVPAGMMIILGFVERRRGRPPI